MLIGCRTEECTARNTVSKFIDRGTRFRYGIATVHQGDLFATMPTHYEGTPDEVLALDTYIKLSRAMESLDARLSRQHTLDGLTLTQFGVLEVLYHLGSLSQTAIGAKLLKSGGNITLVIDNLEKHGYVKRRRCENDRRIMWVDLTPLGRAKIEAILPVHVAAITAEMRVLPDDELRELGRLLRKLGRNRDAAICEPIDNAYDYDI